MLEISGLFYFSFGLGLRYLRQRRDIYCRLADAGFGAYSRCINGFGYSRIPNSTLHSRRIQLSIRSTTAISVSYKGLRFKHISESKRSPALHLPRMSPFLSYLPSFLHPNSRSFRFSNDACLSLFFSYVQPSIRLFIHSALFLFQLTGFAARILNFLINSQKSSVFFPE